MRTVLISLFLIPLTAHSVSTSAGKDLERTAVDANNAFAFHLYQSVRSNKTNLFFSPYSIATALSMTYAGADGETKKQMAEVLHFSPSDKKIHKAMAALAKQISEGNKKGAYTLDIANAIWIQAGYTILKTFTACLKKNYAATPYEVNFAKAAETARKKINTWVENQTAGKIKDLIQPGMLGPLTRLVLTNAVYFKGQWASQFKPEQTKEAPFLLLDGKKVSCPLMQQKGDFRYGETTQAQLLEMPYSGDDLSMVVILPRENTGITELEKDFSEEKLKQWLRGLYKREVVLLLPRFTLTAELSLSDTLKAMGMKDAFSLPPADFSAITGKKDLFISSVIHKAFVQVNEEGTEAAAATAVMMKMLAMPDPPPVFRADHPFIFLIRDKRSGSILFMGRLIKPEPQQK
jgi:serpin B